MQTVLIITLHRALVITLHGLTLYVHWCAE